MRTVVGIAAAAALSAGAYAQIETIDSMIILERFFNDYPDSDLTVKNAFPSAVVFHEQDFGQGGFANRHVGKFSNDAGMTPFVFDTMANWDISVDLTLEGTAVGEAGYLFGPLGNDAQFIVKPNGEIAAFGGFFPFFSNNVNAPQIPQYMLGDTVNLRMVFMGGPAPTIDFLVDGISAIGPTPVDLSGLQGDVLGGVYVQNTPFNQQDVFSTVTFENFVLIPSPGAAALFVLAAVAAGGRRRR